MNNSIFMTIFIIIHNIQATTPNNIFEIENNSFHKTNEIIRDITNKLFNTLKISKNFTKSPNIPPLLTMHDALKEIGENNYKLYENIKNISKIHFNDTNKNLFNINELVTEILYTQHYKVSVDNTTIEDQFNSMKEAIEDYVLIDTNSTIKEKKLTFLKGIVTKLDNLTLEDIVSPLKNIRNKLKSIRKFPRRRNLDVWNATATNAITNLTGNRRIYKGLKTKINFFPFMASIHVADEFMCSGSVISIDLVITAASCLQLYYYRARNSKLYQDNPGSITVRVGSDYTKRLGKRIPISKIYFHPAYDPSTLGNNLAIVRLSQFIKFQNKKIQRIQYDRRKEPMPRSDKVIILGWGDKGKYAIKDSDPLAYAELDIYDFKTCKEIYSKKYVKQYNFCAGFISRGGGACSRDVGSPAVAHSMLLGVVTFGPPECGAPDAPTVFTKLGYYVQWIDQVVRKGWKPVIRKLPKGRTKPQNLPPPTYRTTTLRPTEITTHIRSQSQKLAKKRKLSQRSLNIAPEMQILTNLLKKIVLSSNVDVEDILYEAGMKVKKPKSLSKTANALNMYKHAGTNRSFYMVTQKHAADTFTGSDEDPFTNSPKLSSRHTKRPNLDYWEDSVHKTPSVEKKAKHKELHDKPRHEDHTATRGITKGVIDMDYEHKNLKYPARSHPGAEKEIFADSFSETELQSGSEPGLSIEELKSERSSDTKIRFSVNERPVDQTKYRQHQTAVINGQRVDSGEFVMLLVDEKRKAETFKSRSSKNRSSTTQSTVHRHQTKQNTFTKIGYSSDDRETHEQPWREKSLVEYMNLV